MSSCEALSFASKCIKFARISATRRPTDVRDPAYRATLPSADAARSGLAGGRKRRQRVDMRRRPSTQIDDQVLSGFLTQSEARAVRLERLQQKAMMTGSTAEAARRFAEHDHDGNQELDWEEFYAMQPRRLRDRYTHAEAELGD